MSKYTKRIENKILKVPGFSLYWDFFDGRVLHKGSLVTAFTRNHSRGPVPYAHYSVKWCYRVR